MLRDAILKKTNITAEDLIKQEREIVENLLLHPDDIESLKRLGLIFFYHREFKQSLEIYEKIEKLDSSIIEIKGFLGYLNYELGNYGKAIKYFNEFLDIEPSDAFIYFLLGNAYSRKGKIMEAIDSYEFAIFLDFDIYIAHLDFAREYESLERYRKALVEYIAAYQIDPRDKSIEKKIIEIENRIKDMKKSV